MSMLVGTRRRKASGASRTRRRWRSGDLGVADAEAALTAVERPATFPSIAPTGEEV